jgi:RimJ/RimL family protein N-acetyltransferase
MPNATRELEGDLGEWLRVAGEIFDAGERYPFGVFLKEGTLVGHVTVTPEEAAFEFGYWTHVRHLRNGYTTEAIRALIGRFAPATFVIHCSPDNAASKGVAATLGFRHVGMEPNGDMRWELVVPPRYN